MTSNNYYRMNNVNVRHHKHNNKAGLIVRADVMKRFRILGKARVKK